MFYFVHALNAPYNLELGGSEILSPGAGSWELNSSALMILLFLISLTCKIIFVLTVFAGRGLAYNIFTLWDCYIVSEYSIYFSSGY